MEYGAPLVWGVIPLVPAVGICVVLVLVLVCLKERLYSGSKIQKGKECNHAINRGSDTCDENPPPKNRKQDVKPRTKAEYNTSSDHTHSNQAHGGDKKSQEDGATTPVVGSLVQESREPSNPVEDSSVKGNNTYSNQAQRSAPYETGDQRTPRDGCTTTVEESLLKESREPSNPVQDSAFKGSQEPIKGDQEPSNEHHRDLPEVKTEVKNSTVEINANSETAEGYTLPEPEPSEDTSNSLLITQTVRGKSKRKEKAQTSEGGVPIDVKSKPQFDDLKASNSKTNKHVGPISRRANGNKTKRTAKVQPEKNLDSADKKGKGRQKKTDDDNQTSRGQSKKLDANDPTWKNLEKVREKLKTTEKPGQTGPQTYGDFERKSQERLKDSVVTNYKGSDKTTGKDKLSKVINNWVENIESTIQMKVQVVTLDEAFIKQHLHDPERDRQEVRQKDADIPNSLENSEAQNTACWIIKDLSHSTITLYHFHDLKSKVKKTKKALHSCLREYPCTVDSYEPCQLQGVIQLQCKNIGHQVSVSSTASERSCTPESERSISNHSTPPKDQSSTPESERSMSHTSSPAPEQHEVSSPNSSKPHGEQQIASSDSELSMDNCFTISNDQSGDPHPIRIILCPPTPPNEQSVSPSSVLSGELSAIPQSQDSMAKTSEVIEEQTVKDHLCDTSTPEPENKLVSSMPSEEQAVEFESEKKITSTVLEQSPERFISTELSTLNCSNASEDQFGIQKMERSTSISSSDSEEQVVIVKSTSKTSTTSSKLPVISQNATSMPVCSTPSEKSHISSSGCEGSVNNSSISSEDHSACRQTAGNLCNLANRQFDTNESMKSVSIQTMSPGNSKDNISNLSIDKPDTPQAENPILKTTFPIVEQSVRSSFNNPMSSISTPSEEQDVAHTFETTVHSPTNEGCAGTLESEQTMSISSTASAAQSLTLESTSVPPHSSISSKDLFTPVTSDLENSLVDASGPAEEQIFISGSPNTPTEYPNMHGSGRALSRPSTSSIEQSVTEDSVESNPSSTSGSVLTEVGQPPSIRITPPEEQSVRPKCRAPLHSSPTSSGEQPVIHESTISEEESLSLELESNVVTPSEGQSFNSQYETITPEEQPPSPRSEFTVSRLEPTEEFENFLGRHWPDSSDDEESGRYKQDDETGEYE